MSVGFLGNDERATVERSVFQEVPARNIPITPLVSVETLGHSSYVDTTQHWFQLCLVELNALHGTGTQRKSNPNPGNISQIYLLFLVMRRASVYLTTNSLL